MTAVLVTGASGFIGRHTLGALVARGYDVHAVSPVPESPQPGVRWHLVNLLDPAAVRDLLAAVAPTHLLHAGWCVTPGQYTTSPENLHWVRASLTLFEEFARHGGRHAVAAGTCFEYDLNYGYCSERTPLAPSTLYGAAKASLGQVALAYARQAGFTLAWARIFFLYGPHEHPSRFAASVLRSLLLNQPARCSHGNQIRDFLHVQDVANGLVAALQAGLDGPVNVASGQPLRLKDLIYRAADMVGRRDLVQLGAIPVPPDEPPLIVGDVRRLTRETDWMPTFDLDAGLGQTIEWWRAALAGKP
jgi:nucleoside-diphosphate-sugar epimerase